MNLFIGDVHLERIPQYSVRAMKLKFEVLGEEVSILGKWSSKNQIIRFQEMIHISLTSSALAAVKTNVLSDFELQLSIDSEFYSHVRFDKFGEE